MKVACDEKKCSNSKSVSFEQLFPKLDGLLERLKFSLCGITKLVESDRQRVDKFTDYCEKRMVEMIGDALNELESSVDALYSYLEKFGQAQNEEKKV